jgi:hypothetical protein
MDHTASLVVSLVAIGISALTIIRIKRAEKIGDDLAQCYGDFPALPQEFAAGGNSFAALGGESSTEHSATRRVITDGSHSHEERF